MATLIIALYCWCDDGIRGLNQGETQSVSRMSDAEVVTTALVAALYFAGHQDHARVLLHEQGYIPMMLSKSRFNRRLHQFVSCHRTWPTCQVSGDRRFDE